MSNQRQRESEEAARVLRDMVPETRSIRRRKALELAISLLLARALDAAAEDDA